MMALPLQMLLLIIILVLLLRIITNYTYLLLTSYSIATSAIGTTLPNIIINIIINTTITKFANANSTLM